MRGVCPSCGTPNPVEAHFCSACGGRLDDVCATCGDVLPAASEACATCGALPEIRHRLRERKLVTIVFADITGATALGERLDVERLQELMSAFHDAMRFEVEAMGGVVDTFVGDAVLAIFGVPAAHDDDPDRALGAARRMYGRLDELNQTVFGSVGVRVGMRIGVNTGEVIVAAADTPELGRIAGDAVNVAARLLEHAVPGTVVVAERTAATSHSFRFRDLGTVTLRGRSEPVRIFELGAALRSPDRSSIMDAPIVGRDHELSLLETLFERVEREGVPHLVTIYGAAGVGKSRLVSEVIGALSHRRPAPTILVGRCRPYGEIVAYGALSDIIKGQAGIGDEDSPDVAAARIDQLVRTLDEPTASGDVDRIAEALTYTAGIGTSGSPLPDMSPRQISAEIRTAWRWFFTKLARQREVVVLVEDIHWADPALLDLLEDLADRVEGPMLLLCPARPQLTDSRPGWGGGHRSFSSILLDPLTLDESTALLGFLTATDGLPSELQAQILQRAEGNPFFLEEIIKSLIDAGSITRTDDGLRAVSGRGDVQIPDTVHAVVAARIDLLDSEHKRVLQCAAVVGRSFWAGALAFLLGWDSADVGEVLDDLVRRDLITPRIDSVVGGQSEYRFRHVLIRDVAYESLSRTDRSSIHRWVAEWFSGPSGERQADLIGLRAHHLLNAYDGLAAHGDTDAAEVRRDAFEALLAASAQAKRRVALGEAKHFAREARRIAVSLAEESGAAEALGEAFFYGYEGDAAWQYLAEAVDLRLASDDPDPHSIAGLCARALEMPVRWPGAMTSPPSEEIAYSYLNIGMEHAVDPEGPDAVRLLTLKGFWQHAFPKKPDDPVAPLIGPHEAIESATSAVEIARRLGRADLESGALDGLSACHIPEGAFTEALAASQQRLRLVDELRDLWEIGDTFAMNSWSTYHLGHFRRTLAYAGEGFTRTVGLAPSLALHCLRFRAQARFQLGDWTAAVEDYRLGRRLLGEQKDVPPHYVSPMFAAVALVYEIRGEHAEADVTLEVLRRRYETSTPADRDGLPFSRWAEFVAPLLARRNRLSEARAIIDATSWRRQGRLGLLLEAALEVAEDSDDWGWAADLIVQARRLAQDRAIASLGAAANATDGRMALARGDVGRSIELLEAAVTGHSERGAVWAVARTELALAAALDMADRTVDAAAVLSRCIPVLEHLGARREIDSARELTSAISDSAATPS